MSRTMPNSKNTEPIHQLGVSNNIPLPFRLLQTKDKPKTSTPSTLSNQDVKTLEQNISDLSYILTATLVHHAEIKKHGLPKEMAQIFNLTDDWILLVDERYIIHYANRSFLDSIAMESDQIQGTPIEACSSAAFIQSELKSIIDDAFHSRTQEVKIKATQHDQTLTIQPLPIRSDQGKITKICLWIKASDTKAVQRAQDIPTDYLNQLTHYIYIFDDEGQLRFQNTTASKNANWMHSQMTFDQRNHTGNLKFAIDKTHQDGRWESEIKCQHQHDPPMTLRAVFTCVPHSKDIILNAYNITQQKKMERQLFRAQRLESIGTLASGIAHDLNNILSTFVLALKAFQTIVPKTNQSQRLLELMHSNTDRGVSLIRQILSYLRGVEEEDTEIDMNKLVHDLNIIITETFPNSVTFKPFISNSLSTFRGNYTQIHQVFMNLCVNARDSFPPNHDGIISLFCENILSSEDPLEYVKITVRDNGKGIPKDIVERIFDPFFTTKEVGKGTGLGLSTVRHIVENHGGKINVESSNKGSLFEIWLPASAKH